MLSRKIFTALILVLSLFALPAAGQISRIEQDFVQWTQITVDGNPPQDSDAFASLGPAERADFGAAVQAFLAEDWTVADTLADSLGYEVVAFRDTGNSGETYYGLLPEPDNDDSRGFYFVRPRANVVRRLVLEAPHAVEDKRTGVFATEIFRATGARAVLISGVDRCANDELSGCDGSSSECVGHRISDMAHATETFFQVFHERASTEHADTHVLQLHGFLADVSTKPEFSVSDGSETDNSDLIYLPNLLYREIQERMEAANPSLTRHGNSCNLAGHQDFKCGTQSVQGRFTNGSPDACEDAAPSANGRFIHLEMHTDLRDPKEPDDFYSQQIVIDAVIQSFRVVARVGDRIWADLDRDDNHDAGEPGIHGAVIEVLDTNGNVVESTTSVAGNYQIGNLPEGSYRVRVQLPAGYTYGSYLGEDGVGPLFFLPRGQNRNNIDLALVPPAVGEIGDLVWADDGDGVQEVAESGVTQSVSVELLTPQGDVVAATTTDALDGSYTLTKVLPGDYRLRVTAPSGQGFTQAAGAAGVDSDIDPQTGTSAPFSLASGESETTLDAGLLSPCFDIGLVAEGSRWRWWTPSPTDSVPSDWHTPGFTGDTAQNTPWQAGIAPLGFNTSRARTTITSPDRANGAYTTYFRLAFESPDPAVVQGGIELTLTRDDGVVVYLNGTEILRRNLPWGLVPGSGTPASTKADTIETVTVPVAALVSGRNVIAVELHQSIDGNDSNGLFDLGLTAGICQSCRVGQVELGGLVSTYISNDTDKSTSNFDTSLKLEVDGSPVKKALLRWNTLPAVLTGADILAANLTVTVATGSSSSSDDPYGIYALLQSWDPATVTYVHPWEPDGIGDAVRGSDRLGVTPLNPALGGTVTIPLTETGVQVIEQWVSGALANNGLVLQAEPGSSNGLDLQSDRTANPPRLRVLYAAPSCQ